MKNKTTQILKEFREKYALKDGKGRVQYYCGTAKDLEKWLTTALSQQQVLDLDIMKDEGEVEYAYMDNTGTGQWITLEGDRKARNEFRKELRKAIQELKKI